MDQIFPVTQNTAAYFNIEVGFPGGDYFAPEDIKTINDLLRVPLYQGSPANQILLYDPANAGQFPNGCVLVGPASPAQFNLAYTPKCQ